LKQALVWERLVLALDADEVALARYLEGLLVGEFKKDATAMLRLHVQPRNLVDANVARRRSHADTIVMHTIRRLARTDAGAATVLWRRLRPSLGVSETQARRMTQDLTIENARAGNPDLEADLSSTPDGRHLDVAEALLLAGIGGANWPAVERWTRALDPTERAKPRWRYWLARALDATAPLESQSEVAEIYGSLARERQYYGFLSAMMIGAAPVLNERPSQPNPALIAELESRPVLARVTELFAVNDPINARREWQAFDATLDLEHKAAAAHLAAARGWISQSVMAANAAKLDNDLALRFPAPFRETFVASSKASLVPLGFLYAIARQESVFDPAARSLAGALGVMQMIPGTAAATARAFGLPTPRADRLMDADFNIDLGARHLAQLMTRFAQHRVLVAAAYNAGPQRVDRWLLARPAQPIDIWIETIPFVETRNYVKNVMAFAYIYGQMLGQPQPFLHETEQ
jgi:soluble lytic murein transglycosylase